MTDSYKQTDLQWKSRVIDVMFWAVFAGAWPMKLKTYSFELIDKTAIMHLVVSTQQQLHFTTDHPYWQ